MIEDANLAAGIKRATQIVKDNLLLIGISTIGVGWVTGLIGFVSVLAGLALGGGIGYGIIAAAGSSTTGLIIGIAVGALIFFAFVVAANLVTTYTTTAYHTCLLLWARDVRRRARRARPLPWPHPRRSSGHELSPE